MAHATSSPWMALVLVGIGGCNGARTAEPRDGSVAIHYPEIFIVNDLSRFRRLGVNTEVDTGNHVNSAAGLFASSSALIPNTLQIVLVGQRTFTTVAEDLRHTPGPGGTVSYKDLLEQFAAWRAVSLLHSPATMNDAAILLTDLDDSDRSTEIAFLGQMCNSTRAVAVVKTGHTLAFDSASIAHAIGHLVGMCHDPPADRGSGSPACPTLPATLAQGSTCYGRVMAESRVPGDPPESFSGCSASDFNEWARMNAPSPICATRP
jgi:hypothetical protein